MKLKLYLVLFSIILFGFLLRMYGLNWDSGFHMHPDERAIIMYTLDLKWPTSPAQFFSEESSWNPHFFAYGSFPLYLLRIVSWALSPINPSLATYDGIVLVGRVLASLFDSGILVILFILGKKIFSKRVALLATFLYAICVFPIQLSHFWTVDIPLTFFLSLSLLALIYFYQKPSLTRACFVGIATGLALATKTSATVLLAAIAVTLFADFFLIFIRSPHKPHVWFPHIPRFLQRLLLDGCLILVVIFFTFIFFEPYALIDFKSFWQQTLQQSQMTQTAFAFPYTLQYVGKTPYVYELKNMILWGMGPILGIFSCLGFLFVVCRKPLLRADRSIVLIFCITYFIVVGKFAVGWMRYMLPLYPLLILFGAFFIYTLGSRIKNRLLHGLYYFTIVLGVLGWTIAFMHIYTLPNTRVQATNWILSHVPQASTLAIEHWDDSLPLIGQNFYHMETLALYDSDASVLKWKTIHSQLQNSDYIILASNRLYVPLQKLTDCQKLDSYHCYPLTAKYYQDLFSGALGFQKVAEFASNPTIPLTNLTINDQPADESFTVYDHPKIIIFQKRLVSPNTP